MIDNVEVKIYSAAKTIADRNYPIRERRKLMLEMLRNKTRHRSDKGC